jgi:hypothetical protein
MVYEVSENDAVNVNAVIGFGPDPRRTNALVNIIVP